MGSGFRCVHSLLGLAQAQAQEDLRGFVRNQLGDHPMSVVLARFVACGLVLARDREARV